VKLGLLQLRRARRRSAALIGTVTALAALVLLIATISATLFVSLAGAIATMRADVLVMTAAAQGTVQASRLSEEALRAVSEVDGVARTAAVGESRVTVRLDGELADASLFGVAWGDPGAPTSLVSGREPTRPGEVVVDAADLRRGFVPGREVEVVGTDVRLRVVGVSTGGRFGGVVTLYAAYGTWEQVFGELFPNATELRPQLMAVAAAPGMPVDELARRIEREVDGVAARTPEQAALALPGLGGIRDSFRLIGAIAIGAVLLLTGSFFSLVTAQMEETLAVLRTIGVPASRLAVGLLTQVVVIVAIGVTLASALLGLAGRAAPPTFPLSPQPGEVAVLAATLLVGGVVAVAPAIRRLVRVDPMTALTRAGR
jgi:putative ABC transport system permease protein